jgi:hypothetical protein
MCHCYDMAIQSPRIKSVKEVVEEGATPAPESRARAASRRRGRRAQGAGSSSFQMPRPSVAA